MAYEPLLLTFYFYQLERDVMTTYQNGELIIDGTRRANIAMAIAGACSGAAVFCYMKMVQQMTIRDVNTLLRELYDIKPKNHEGL